MSNVFEQNGYSVRSSDIIDRTNGQIEIIDFLNFQGEWNGDIVSNPPYKCFSSDTQCYTKCGWKNYNELNYNDEILSINPNTLEVEWSKIHKIIIKRVDEDLIHFKKSHMDILCTTDHRMFAFNKNCNKLAIKNGDLIRSQDVRETHYIPREGYKWDGKTQEDFILPKIVGHNYAQLTEKPEIKIPIENWIKFFGLWLADGYCRHTNNSFGDNRKSVGIKQSVKTAEYIREVLAVLPFEHKEYLDNYGRKNNCINFEIHDEQLWEYLKDFGKSQNKYVPVFIKELDSRLLNIFIDAYFYGDGSTYLHSGRIYRTISKRLAEDLQEILLKLGFLSHITSNTYKTQNGEERILYSIVHNPNSQYNRMFYPSSKNKKCNVHYTGNVWCVNLERNGVFLLRRNGKEFISGNCAKEFIEKALEIVPDGNKVAMFLKITFLESKNRKLLFAKHPFKTLYVSSSRLQCAKNGDFETYKKGTGTAVAYGWYVWEKGFKGDPIIKWIN